MIPAKNAISKIESHIFSKDLKVLVKKYSNSNIINIIINEPFVIKL